MDTTTLFVIILMIIVLAIMFFVSVKSVRMYIRRRKLHVKTPKVRGRPILRDEQKFGSAIVVGYSPMGIGMESAIIHLLGADGHMFQIPYHKDEVYPENALHAMAGGQKSIWRVRGSTYLDKEINPELHELSKQNTEMKEERIRLKAKSKQAINEAATVPDRIDELTKELIKGGRKDTEIKVR